MATSLIRHRVRDYDAWRNVRVLHRFRTQRQAEDFPASTELKNAMHEAGVEGPPQIDIYDEAD